MAAKIATTSIEARISRLSRPWMDFSIVKYRCCITLKSSFISDRPFDCLDDSSLPTFVAWYGRFVTAFSRIAECAEGNPSSAGPLAHAFDEAVLVDGDVLRMYFSSRPRMSL